jgi:hypothetical protein
MNAPDLSPILRQQRSVQNDYAAKTAANTFSRGLAQQRGARNIFDFKQNFGRQMPSFTAGYAQRGMTGPGVQSGVYQQAMQNFVGDHTRGLGRLTEDNFNTNREFDMNQSRFDAEKSSAFADLEARKAELIARTALGIQAVRPLMGAW